MPYSVAWDESVPAGSSDARFLDDRMRDRQTAIRERLSDLFGGLTLLEFQADPILLKGIRGGGDADFDIRGGTATTSFKDAAGVNNDLQIDHATGDATVRRNISALGGFRYSLDGWAVTNSAASTAAVEIVRPGGRVLVLRAGSVLSILIAANAAQFATAGNLTVEVWKGSINAGNGVRTDVATGLTAVLNVANPAFKLTTQAIGLMTVVPGDELFIKWATDAAWLPVALSFKVAIEVET